MFSFCRSLTMGKLQISELGFSSFATFLNHQKRQCQIFLPPNQYLIIWFSCQMMLHNSAPLLAGTRAASEEKRRECWWQRQHWPWPPLSQKKLRRNSTSPLTLYHEKKKNPQFFIRKIRNTLKSESFGQQGTGGRNGIGKGEGRGRGRGRDKKKQSVREGGILGIKGFQGDPSVIRNSLGDVKEKEVTGRVLCSHSRHLYVFFSPLTCDVATGDAPRFLLERGSSHPIL